MTWSSEDIEEKEEENAKGRSRASKIIERDSYKGESPGKVTVRIQYINGFLNVHLLKAEDLYGKRSQDPYALVYLLDKSGMSYFQRGNNRTDFKSKTLNPEFNHEFKFKMSLNDVVSKSLVIALWDRDSTSRDDYMSGVRISMRDVQYFTEIKHVTLQTQHQDLDGHPAAFFPDPDKLIREWFRWEMPVITSGLDLKSCNNHLLAFIDRVRVLAQAYDFKNNLPDLANSVSIMPPDVRAMFMDEVTRYQGKVHKTRDLMAELRNKKAMLMEKNRELLAEREAKTTTLVQKRQDLYNHEVRFVELEAQCGSVNFIQERITAIEEQIRIIRERQRGSVVKPADVSESEMYLRESMRDMPSFGHSRGGGSSSQSLSREFEIRVRTEYEQRMREKLDAKRHQYHSQYQEFILVIERDAAEIIRLYEDILREKFTPKRLDALKAIWDKRGYQARISQLERDIEDIREKIGLHTQEVTRTKAWHDDELARLQAQVDALMRSLRDLFTQFTAFTNSRYSEFNEVSIYNQLLNFEDGRMAASRPKVEVKVSKRTSRRTAASSAVQGGSIISRSSYSSSYRRNPRESGYSSPAKTPEGTLDGTNFNFENQSRFSQSGADSVINMSRTSRMDSRTSTTLEMLKPEVM